MRRLKRTNITYPLAYAVKLVTLLRRCPGRSVPRLRRVLRRAGRKLNKSFTVNTRFVARVRKKSSLPTGMLRTIPSKGGCHLCNGGFFYSITRTSCSIIATGVSNASGMSAFVIPS